MSHFQYLPKVTYDVIGDGTDQTFTHILKRVGLSLKSRNVVLTYDFYDIRTGQTPEEIALNYYGSSNLYWLLFLANDIKDIYHDWPMSESQFESYLYDKYGSDIGSVHHYEIYQESGDTSVTIDIGEDNTFYPSATPITNYEYENRLQDEKRKIRLIRPSFVERIIGEMEELSK